MTLKAIITIGIPCSGKSTWAEEFCAKNGYIEINRDNSRMNLFSLDRYNDYKHSRVREQQVTELNRAQMLTCSIAQKNIVLSDTNLNKGFRTSLQAHLEGLGYEVSYKVFDIEFFDALRRNDRRKDKHIPRSVMYNMYRNFMDYQEEQGEWTKYVPNNNLPPAYVVDIDGTIATNDGKRGWYDWADVGKDMPILSTLNLLDMIRLNGDRIILLSGRDAVCREETVDWLKRYRIPYDELFMRPEGSMDKDRFVKHELFNQQVATRYNVKAVFDDRPQVCLLWHDLGLPLFKVGDPLAEF